MPPRARRYTYSERAGRYGLSGPASRFVSRREIRQSVDGALERGAQAVGALTQRLRAGEITLAEWQLAMIKEIRSATLASLAAAHGGFDRLSPAMYGRAGSHLKRQYQFLRDFAARIAETGVVDGNTVRYAMSYLGAARNLHEKEVSRTLEARGFDQIRSIRRARDSCRTKVRSGCVEQARKGWQDLADYVYPGERTCLGACQCYSLRRNSLTGDVAA